MPGDHRSFVMSCPSLRGGNRIQYIFPKNEIHDNKTGVVQQMYESLKYVNIVLCYICYFNCRLTVI